MSLIHSLYRPIRLPHQSLLYPSQPYSFLPLSPPPHHTLYRVPHINSLLCPIHYSIPYPTLPELHPFRISPYPPDTTLPYLTTTNKIPPYTHTYFTIPFPPLPTLPTLPTLFLLHLTQCLRHNFYRFYLVN